MRNRDQDDVLTTVLNALCFAVAWATAYVWLVNLMGYQL